MLRMSVNCIDGGSTIEDAEGDEHKKEDNEDENEEEENKENPDENKTNLDDEKYKSLNRLFLFTKPSR